MANPCISCGIFYISFKFINNPTLLIKLTFELGFHLGILRRCAEFKSLDRTYCVYKNKSQTDTHRSKDVQTQ